MNSIKEILFRIFPKRTPGSVLCWISIYLIGGLGIVGLVIELKVPNGLTLSLSDGSTSIPSWAVGILSILAIVTFIIGVVLQVLDWKKARGERKNKAKGITLLSLPVSRPPQLEEQFYQTIESSRTTRDSNLVKIENESDSQWLSRSETSLNQLTNHTIKELEAENPNLVLAVGAIAHIPHAFGLGFLLANRRNTNYYCWDRDRKDKENNNWLDVRNIMGFNTKFNHRLVSSNNANIKKLGLSVEVSMNNDENIFMEILSLDAVVVISVNNPIIGNLFSYEGQVSLVKGIREHLNNCIFNQYKSIEELHITIMAQSSFVMRLASEFNQNHFPAILKVHHYQNHDYPWCAVMNPNNPSIAFELNNNRNQAST